ncbi:MAG: 30S ribosomal protein S6 [gamma proteobacterium endosymbiont of Trioza apicalis]
MFHYEIIILINSNPDVKIIDIINYYKKLINNQQGKIHRLENWGKRQLSYPIKNLNKAYYILLNIEVTKKLINKLINSFKINNAIVRNLIIKVKQKITNTSSILLIKDNKN